MFLACCPSPGRFHPCSQTRWRVGWSPSINLMSAMRPRASHSQRNGVLEGLVRRHGAERNHSMSRLMSVHPMSRNRLHRHIAKDDSSLLFRYRCVTSQDAYQSANDYFYMMFDAGWLCKNHQAQQEHKHHDVSTA